jgi:hypothetical protein
MYYRRRNGQTEEIYEEGEEDLPARDSVEGHGNALEDPDENEKHIDKKNYHVSRIHPTKRSDKDWDDYWEWYQKTAYNVGRLYGQGIRDPYAIASRLYVKVKFVRAILAKKGAEIEVRKAARQAAKQLYGEKVNVLKDILGLGLNVTREYLEEMQDITVRDERLQTLQDFKALAETMVKYNELLRLDLGQSTQNVAVIQYSWEETRKLLMELKNKEPGVFDLPDIGPLPQPILEDKTPKEVSLESGDKREPIEVPDCPETRPDNERDIRLDAEEGGETSRGPGKIS